MQLQFFDFARMNERSRTSEDLFGDGVVFLGGYNRSLVIEDAPGLLSLFPDGRASGEAAGLVECVGQQKAIGTEATQGESGSLPPGGIAIDEFVCAHCDIAAETNDVVPASGA